MNWSEMGVSGVVIIVIIAFAAFGFAKGTLKLIYGFLCLIGTLFAAWLGYAHAYPLLANKWPEMPEHGEYACALAAGALGFFLLKTCTDFFTNPFASEEEKRKGSSGLLGLLTGFALGFILCLLAMYKLIDKGTKAEIDYWLSQLNDASAEELPKLTQLKYEILSSPIGRQVSQYISSNSQASRNLSQLIVMHVAAPDRITTLSQDPSIAAVIKNPKVKSVLDSPEIKQSIENGDTEAVIAHPEFIALINDPELNSAISQIDIEQALKLR